MLRVCVFKFGIQWTKSTNSTQIETVTACDIYYLFFVLFSFVYQPSFSCMYSFKYVSNEPVWQTLSTAGNVSVLTLIRLMPGQISEYPPWTNSSVAPFAHSVLFQHSWPWPRRCCRAGRDARSCVSAISAPHCLPVTSPNYSQQHIFHHHFCNDCHYHTTIKVSPTASCLADFLLLIEYFT